jgi:CYTH domain-containing protein
LDFQVERKFRLSKLPDIDLGSGHEIEQGYIILANDELRLRKMDGVCYVAVKDSQPVNRICWQQKIPENVFEGLWERDISGMPIAKTRYKIPFNGVNYELDVYHTQPGYRELEGLIILECKFPDTESSDALVLPQWAINAGAVDVSYDPDFKNNSLALFGLPKNFKEI